MGKVTVIIPYVKDRGWLKDAIDSVPSDVQLILSKGKGNVSVNLNRALRQAEGEFIKYLDEDDMLTENCIEDSLRTFSEQGCDFIHGNAINLHMAGKHGRMESYIPEIKYPTLHDMIVKNVIHGGTLMYRREVFDRVGYYDESLQWSEEVDFNMRCLKAGLKIGYCDSFLYYYHRHEGQKSLGANANQQLREKNRQMIKNRYR